MMLTITALIALLSSSTTETIEKSAEVPKPQGPWAYALNFGSNVAYSHSSGVVGTPNGSTFKLGLQIDSSATWTHQSHKVASTFEVNESFSKTPQLSPWLKALDTFKFTTMYTYALPRVPWLGPFVGFALQTQALPGFNISSSDTNVVRIRSDGIQEEQVYAAQHRIPLTGAFEPLQLRESTGFSATAVERTALNVQVNLGLATQQILARHGYVVDDDAQTSDLELRQLQSQYQTGAEFTMKASGEWHERLSYKAEANVLQPFYSSDGRQGLDALQAEFKATFSVKVIQWISIDYILMAKRVPSILSNWQIQNGLVLTAKYQIF